MVSKFPLGTVVAYITTHPRGGRTIFKATVNKVRKDHKFFVSWTRKDAGGNPEIVKSDTMWTPISDHPEARESGRQAGRGYATSSSIEVWTATHDEEIQAYRRVRTMDRNRDIIKSQMDQLKPEVEGDRNILAAIFILLKDRKAAQ